ncbi:HtaA domain-containing protein [Brevibacterium sp. S111]|uniref:HtaA domain-containing protein n=1 Tax=Brevibacterium sp. S111 TaxID=2483795 RepID=UPI0014369A8A|nr:HtaA domain-containing protein [Brevibacterium sp. S111]
MHTHTSTRRGKVFTRTAAGIAALGLLGFGLTAPAEAVTAPYSVPTASTASPVDEATETDGPLNIDDAVFEWSVNDESTGGAYFGGCNFLVPGKAGDAGQSRVWTDADAGKLFPTDSDDASGNFTDGRVSIVKTSGKYTKWGSRCLTGAEDPDKAESVNGNINAEAKNNHTGDHVEITGGSGTIDVDKNNASIQWEGSWTFAYYGGMTYWTISDPTLEVEDGKGTITGTYSGYGADMDDPSIWKELKPRDGDIVEIQKGEVDVTDEGFEFTPDYLGVKTDTDGRNIQAKQTAENESWWGAMPQDWIDFNVETGQDSYWYTTDGASTSLQPRKKTNPLAVSYGKPVEKPGDGGDPTNPDDPGDDGSGAGDDGSGDKGSGDSGKNAGSADGSATLYWSINQEANGGAFYGGCNFLVAGKSKDTGSAKVWPSGGGDYYRSKSGNVRIEKPEGSTFKEASWDDRCLDSTGEAVSTSRKGSWTQSRVAIKNGEVSEADDGVTVQWKGSFTVAFYGGMTYWSATDPKLEVDGNGKGRLTADLSGYGADMFDSSKWVALKPESITMANFKNIDIDALLDDGHITATPDYLGVKYDSKGKQGSSGNAVGGSDENASAQAKKTGENSDYWGAFPQDFVDFQHKTGQYSYWFTSGGVRDPYKRAEPMTISLGDYVPGAGDYSAAAGNGGQQQNAGDAGGSAAGAAGSGQSGTGGSGGGQSAKNAKKADAKKTDEVDDETVFAQEAEEVRAASEVPVRAWIAMGTGLAVTIVAGFGIRSGIRRHIGLDPSDIG